MHPLVFICWVKGSGCIIFLRKEVSRWASKICIPLVKLLLHFIELRLLSIKPVVNLQELFILIFEPLCHKGPKISNTFQHLTQINSLRLKSLLSFNILWVIIKITILLSLFHICITLYDKRPTIWQRNLSHFWLTWAWRLEKHKKGGLNCVFFFFVSPTDVTVHKRITISFWNSDQNLNMQQIKIQSKRERRKTQSSYTGSFHKPEVVLSPLHFQGEFTKM